MGPAAAVSRYDSQFCIAGDSALESPTVAKIDDWNPVSITQFTVYPLRPSTSPVFNNDGFAVVGTSLYIDPRFQSPSQIISRIPQNWPFARIGVRFRGYVEPAPATPDLTRYPEVQATPIRFILPSHKYSIAGAPPPDWKISDDLEPVNHSGPGQVEIIDRVAWYSSPPFMLRVRGDLPFIFAISPDRLDPVLRDAFVQHGGRFDPNTDPIVSGAESASYFQRNLSELNNLRDVEFNPGRIPNEQRLVITVYEPQREEEWRETKILELDPN
jgi:hypothetical protein